MVSRAFLRRAVWVPKLSLMDSGWPKKVPSETKSPDFSRSLQGVLVERFWQSSQAR